MYPKVITVVVIPETGRIMEYGGMKMMRFKQLSPEEEKGFRKYAQETDPDKLEDWGIYHPVCRDEWLKRGIEHKGCWFAYEGSNTMARI